MNKKKAFVLIIIIFIFIISFLVYAFSSNTYVGSNECGKCHEEIYSKWQKTLHKSALIDNPSLLPEYLEICEMLKKISETSQVEFAIGKRWTRRYLLSNKTIAPFVYSIPNKTFIEYKDKNYKYTNYEKDCIGCHVTGIEFKNEKISWSENGVTCEACHGMGRNHIRFKSTKFIVNPSKLDERYSLMICMSCHTNGVDKSNSFKYPLGYKPGLDLSQYFFKMLPKPNQLKYKKDSKFYYKGDNSIEDRMRQFEYWQFMLLAKDGLSCEDCLDFRSLNLNSLNSKKDIEFLSINEFCMFCHNDILTQKKHNNEPVKCDFLKQLNHLKKENTKNCYDCHKSSSIHDHYFLPKPTLDALLTPKDFK